jgi:hypothetical protein
MSTQPDMGGGAEKDQSDYMRELRQQMEGMSMDDDTADDWEVARINNPDLPEEQPAPSATLGKRKRLKLFVELLKLKLRF